MRLLFDLESDGLLQEITKIHCMVVKDWDTGKVRRFRSAGRIKDGESIEDGINYLATASVLVGHNIIGFDLPALQKVMGFVPDPDVQIFDTIVSTRLIWSELFTLDVRMKRIPKANWGGQDLKAWGLRLGVFKGAFGETTDWAKWTPQMEDYCAQDVEVTAALVKTILGKSHYIDEDWTFSTSLKLEHEFKKRIAAQERHGFRFDVKGCEALTVDLIKERQRLEQQLQALFPPRIITMKKPQYYEAQDGTKYTTIGDAAKAKVKRNTLKEGPLKTKEIAFNPGSRTQIAERLIEKYGWEPTVFTEPSETYPEGQPDVSEEVLSGLDYPEIPDLCTYLKVNKLLGQIAEGPEAWMNHVRNGRIHGSVNTNGAVTGRCTHSKPNVAQTPKVMVKKIAGKKSVVMGIDGGFGWECRYLYKADVGWKLVGWDASGLELRCLAHFMAEYDDGAYAKVLLEGDIHTVNQTAAALFLRDSAKTFIYAFLYGAGDEKIGTIKRQDFIDAKQPIPKGNLKAMGKTLKAQFLRGVPALEKLKEAIEEALKHRDYLLGLDGRKVKVRSAHAALNTLLQSAGALVMKLALVLMDQDLQDMGYVLGKDYAFVANIHDEVQTTCRPELAEIIGKAGVNAIKKAAEFFEFRCPLDGEYKIGDNWAETH